MGAFGINFSKAFLIGNKNAKIILTVMIELTKGESKSIVVTLSELTTIDPVYYLFVFTHVATKEELAFVAPADESAYPERYNQFTIAPLFDDFPIGEYHYKVYQQGDAENTDVSAAGDVVEVGKMILSDSPLEFEKYNQATTYQQYNG